MFTSSPLISKAKLLYFHANLVQKFETNFFTSSTFLVELYNQIMAPSIAQDAIGSGLGKTEPLNSFHRLVSDLSRILGPSSGLDSEDVDVQKLHVLMEDYMPEEKYWSQYAFSDYSRGYTRNLVDEGNGKSNLVSLVP
jgi:hypothetical protein